MQKLGLRELIAIGVGGMIGGGIFSVMGLAVEIAGILAPAAFLLGGLLALLAGYSYIRLATAFRNDGASFTYLEIAFPRHPVIGAFVGWVVIVGYVGTMALYAFTFGAYAAELMGELATGLVREILSVGIIGIFMLINLFGVRSSGTSEDLIVYGKILLLAILALAGLQAVDLDSGTAIPVSGVSSVMMAGALVFVAFEGFQLITNAVCESEHPERNIARGIYVSIAIVTTLYVLLSVVAVGSMPVEQLVAAKEYALAIAVEPALGNVGRALVSVAAMLATASAINATMFGASRMMAEMAAHREMPKAFSFRNRVAVPWMAVVAMSLLTMALTWLGGLELIAAFSSMTFLLVSLAVCIANWRLRARTQARAVLVLPGILLLLATIGTLIAFLAGHDMQTLQAIGMMYAAVGLAMLLFQRWRPGGRVTE